jgi:hypothetical protein
MTDRTFIRFGRPLLRLAASAIAGALSAAPSLAQQPSLIRSVADGKPWSMTQSNGQTGQVILGSDGTATMQIGSRTVSPTWRVSENGQFCLKPALMIPERCVALRREGAAIVGVSDGAERFRLTRP